MKISLQSRWSVLGALCFMMWVGLALPIYGGSVLGTYMTSELHWERSALGLLIAANMTADGLAAPWVAALVTRIGVRGCLATGCVLMGAASVVLATWVTAPWQAAAAFGVMGLAAAFISVIPCQTAAAAWFGQRRPFVLAVLFAAVGLGGFIFVWVMTGAIQSSTIGYRMGCWVFFVFSVAGLLVALFFVRNKPHPEKLEIWEAADRERFAKRRSKMEIVEPVGPSGIDLRVRDALRSPALWAIYFCMFSTTCGSAFVIAHAQAHLRDLGHSPVSAAATIGIISAALVVGNLGIGAIAQRVAPRTAYFGALVLFALGLITLAYANGNVGLYGYAVIYGIGFGGVQVGPMVLLSSYWNLKVFPMLTAIGLMMQTAGAAVSPVSAGIYFDRTGHYEPVILIIVGMVFISMILLRLIGPPKSRVAAVVKAADNAGTRADIRPTS